MIFPSAHVTPRFLYRQVIEEKERTVFAHRLETVLPVQNLQGIAHLLLHIACRCVHPAQRRVKTAVSALRIVQPVFLFKLTSNLLAAVVVVLVTDTFPVLIHPHRHNVQMVTVDVLVLEYKIRLVAKTELFQILAGDVLQFDIGQHIIRVRVERDMHHRLLHLHLRRQEGEKTLHRLVNVHRSRTVIVDAVGGKQPPMRLIDFLPVVGNRAVQRVSYTDFCDHFASISLDNSTIRRLSFTSSTVCCSSL